jgi:probable nitrogen fixation protein
MKLAGRDPAANGSFLVELVQWLRGQEDDGPWDGRTDLELLASLVVGQEDRGQGPPEGDPDPDVFWLIELFYGAVGSTIQRRTGVACQLLLRMHHEGFGLVVLIGGRLVVVSRILRDVRRFGFPSIEALADAGEKLVSEGVEMIQRYPEVARGT